MKKTKQFKKTDHFWERAWERSINQVEIDKLLQNVNPKKGKNLMVFGKDKLREAGIKRPSKTHMVIIANNNVLVTIFEVPDLFYYLKRNISKAKIILV